jgi:ketosteroid isomerase-like protein
VALLEAVALAIRELGRDTAQAMSQENVEAFKRGVDAFNRGDVEAVVEVIDPEVEWHDVFGQMLGGEATVYRGHEGVRELFGDLSGAFAELHTEYSKIRDLDDRIVAIGHIRTRGSESGAETESPLWTISHWKNGKVTRLRTYLNPKEALEAAGLSE